MSHPPDQLRDRRLNLIIHEISRGRASLFNRIMEPHGLTRAQSWAIGALSRRGGMTQTELARVLGLTRVAAGALVARLEAAGWVERSVDDEDGRLRRVHLTEKCKPIRRVIDAAADQVNDISLAGIDPAERAVLVGLLERMRGNIDSQAEPELDAPTPIGVASLTAAPPRGSRAALRRRT